MAALIALSLTAGVVRVADAAPRASSDPRACASSAAAPAPVPPAGLAPCPAIRPGDIVHAELGTSSATCAVGFMYQDRRRDVYFATGVNCAPPFAFEDGVITWPRGRGPVALDGRTGTRIGEFAGRYAEGDVGMTLVRLDPAVPYSPQVCQYGGPVGIATEVSDDPQQLVMVGPLSGLLDYDFPPYFTTEGNLMRPGLAHLGLYDQDRFTVAGLGLVEDGMPVLTADGRAVGIAESLGVDEYAPAFVMGQVVIRPGRPIGALERAMRTKLTMMTAPLL